MALAFPRAGAFSIPACSPTKERSGFDSRSSPMLRAQDLEAKAEQYDELADTVIDPQLANSLRQRARAWRELAAEVLVLERDPMYRLIHDRPDH